MNFQTTKKNENYAQNDYDCHEAFAIPDSLMQNLKAVSPPLALAIDDFYQEGYNQQNFCCIQLYNQLVSTIENGFATIFDMKKAELLKELISIDGRKKFIKKYQGKEDYSLLVNDAIAHTKPEYEEEIMLKLQKLDELIASMKNK